MLSQKPPIDGAIVVFKVQILKFNATSEKSLFSLSSSLHALARLATSLLLSSLSLFLSALSF